MSAFVALSSDCQTLVRQEIERRGSVRAVASVIGYARPSLSLALAGRYTGRLDAMEAAIRDKLASRVACPHLTREILADECRGHRERPVPTADPLALKHWQACAFCLLNPRRRT